MLAGRLQPHQIHNIDHADFQRGHDVSQRVHQIQAPTLVIHGDVDPLVPLKNGLHLAETIPGATLIVYPITGHIPEVERAEEFNRDILAFLER